MAYSQKNTLKPYYDQQTQRYGYRQDKKVKIKPSFLSASNFVAGVARVETEQGANIINSKGKILFKKNYQDLGSTIDTLILFQNELIPFKKSGKWGLIDKKERECITAKFKEIQYLGSHVYGVQNQEGLWGYYHDSGRQIYPCQLSKVFPFQQSQSIGIQNHRYGLVDLSGNEILPFIYRNITRKEKQWQVIPLPKHEVISPKGKVVQTLFFDTFKNIAPNLYRFTIGNNKGLCNKKGDILTYNTYDTIYPFHKNIAVVTQNQYYGLINTSLKEILAPVYQSVVLESSGLIRVRNQNGQEDLINKSGKNLTYSKYTSIKNIAKNKYVVKQGRQWHYIDTTGRKLNVSSFGQLSEFTGEYAAKKHQGLFGIIDQKGNWVISPLFDSAFVLNEKIFVIYFHQSWATVNTDGQEQYYGSEAIAHVADGMMRIEKNGHYGLINPKGWKILATHCDSIPFRSMGSLIAAWQKGKKIYVDINKKIQPKFSAYDHYSYFGEPAAGFMPVKTRYYYGFADYMGYLRIGAEYDSVKNFSEGRSAVKLGRYWGFINTLGQIVTQPYYDEIFSFKENKAIVKSSEKYGLIDKENHLLIPTVFDSLVQNKHGNWITFQNGKQGFVSSDMRRVLYPKYEQLIDLNNGYIISYKNKHYGLDNTNGLVIVLPEYDKVTFNAFDNTFSLLTCEQAFVIK